MATYLGRDYAEPTNPIRRGDLSVFPKTTAAQIITNLESDERLSAVLEAMPGVYYGTAEPSAELGKDGDLYFQYDEEA